MILKSFRTNSKHPGESGFCYEDNEATATGKHPGESGFCYDDNEATAAHPLSEAVLRLSE